MAGLLYFLSNGDDTDTSVSGPSTPNVDVVTAPDKPVADDDGEDDTVSATDSDDSSESVQVEPTDTVTEEVVAPAPTAEIEIEHEPTEQVVSEVDDSRQVDAEDEYPAGSGRKPIGFR